MTGRPGRREAAIDPAAGPLAKFAYELRILRQRTGGPSFQELARQTRQIGEPFSTSTLRNAVSGSVLPTAEVTAAFVRACLRYARANRQLLADPGVLDQEPDELVERWCRRRNELAQPKQPEPEPDRSQEEAEPQEASESREEPEAGSRSGKPVVMVAATVVVLAAVAAAVAFLLPSGEEPQAAKPIVARSASPVSVDQLAEQCRGAWQRGPVKIDPCITAVPEGVRMSVRVTAVEAAPEVAVHLWLRDATTQQRVPDTLHHCQVSFTEPGQSATCGPVLVRPEPGHSYVAAANADLGTSPVPAMWKDPNATGLNTGAVAWPPR